MSDFHLTKKEVVEFPQDTSILLKQYTKIYLLKSDHQYIIHDQYIRIIEI